MTVTGVVRVDVCDGVATGVVKGVVTGVVTVEVAGVAAGVVAGVVTGVPAHPGSVMTSVNRKAIRTFNTHLPERLKQKKPHIFTPSF